MDQLSNIIASQASQGAQKQAPRAVAAHDGDAQKFMKALNAKLASLKGNTKLGEKLAQLDKKPPAVKADIAQKLQASQPKNDQELLQNLTALLNGDAKPALTTDLSASLALSLQNDAGDQEMLDKLTALFNTGAQDIIQFRDSAIDMMQQAGMAPQQIDRMLVKLSGSLGAQLSPEQQTALMMPLDGDTAPQSAQADTPKFMPAHAADDTDSPPPAAKDAPAPQQATPAQDAPAAAPKSQASAGAHLSLINSFASDDQSASGGFSGQSFSQGTYNMAGTTAGTATTQTAAGTPGSFVNYMSSASSAQTTQTIALQIQRNAQTQVDTFRMQLHPADLGQLEVRLKFGKDGTMKAHLVAEKPETLALLQKDSAQLQKLLEQSGLQMDGSSLSFDLGQQRDQQAQAYQGRDKSPYAGGDEDEDGALATAGVQAKISAEAMGSIRQGGINIMV